MRRRCQCVYGKPFWLVKLDFDSNQMPTNNITIILIVMHFITSIEFKYTHLTLCGYYNITLSPLHLFSTPLTCDGQLRYVCFLNCFNVQFRITLTPGSVVSQQSDALPKNRSNFIASTLKNSLTLTHLDMEWVWWFVVGAVWNLVWF